jgi:hypothetical protein
MDATLHHRALDSYSGQWPRVFPKGSLPRIAVHCP